jgi:hypothetical protein
VNGQIDRPPVPPIRQLLCASLPTPRRRGPGAPQPGSRWWRAVNESLLRDTAEAGLLCDGALGQPSRRGVGSWLEFLYHPTPVTWYRAHNVSIVDGYLRQPRPALVRAVVGRA